MQNPDWTKAEIRTLHRVHPMRSDITMHGIARGARPAADDVGSGRANVKSGRGAGWSILPRQAA